jgi:hypothetical protein
VPRERRYAVAPRDYPYGPYPRERGYVVRRPGVGAVPPYGAPPGYRYGTPGPGYRYGTPGLDYRYGAPAPDYRYGAPGAVYQNGTPDNDDGEDEVANNCTIDRYGVERCN